MTKVSVLMTSLGPTNILKLWAFFTIVTFKMSKMYVLFNTFISRIIVLI